MVNNKELAFKKMSTEDELIGKMYKFSIKIRTRHFGNNLAQVKKDLYQKCQEYYLGNTAPLKFYEYCYNLNCEYLKNVSFMKADSYDFEDYITELIEEEITFNRKVEI